MRARVGPPYVWIGLATLALLGLLLMPGDDAPRVDIPNLDLVVHAALFFCWSIALAYDVAPIARTAWLIVPAAVGFGLLTEVLQLFADQRSFDLRDLLADIFGAVLAVVALSWRARVRPGS